MGLMGGVFVCLACRDEPGDDCGDTCAMSFVHELPPVWDDFWPTCSCCGREAQLVTPLVPLGA
jgi:hypothetical protein